ncbi:MAG: CAP domain-containing protein [Myxococcales bacterium]|nr:CAP domain-containing protein [Myxococcales bacterium]
MRILLAAALGAGLTACPRHPAPARAPVPDATIRYRTGEALPGLGPDAHQDRGLQAAAEALAAAAMSPAARLTTGAVRAALENARYPGPARFVVVVGGRQPPPSLFESVPTGLAVDVGWAWRDYSDGTRWWVLGWCARRLQLDDVPATVLPGRGVGIRVDGGKNPRLFVVAPGGRWREYALVAGSTRWVGDMNERGAYRMEVVDGDRVELLFAVHVAEPIPPVPPLPTRRVLENPYSAVDRLYTHVNDFRRINGLGAVSRFALFEPLVREHALCVAAAGVAAHKTEGCSSLPERATRDYYPRGHYYENVAVADTVDEAWATLLASPGHLSNLLCRDCTNISIAAVMEPVPDPRLYVVWELMAFPAGEPAAIRK